MISSSQRPLPTQYTTNTIGTSMTSGIFKPAIPVIKWLKTNALHHTVTGICETLNYQTYINKGKSKTIPVLNPARRLEDAWAPNASARALIRRKVGVSGTLHTTTALPPGKVSGSHWIGAWICSSIVLEGVQEEKKSLSVRKIEHRFHRPTN